VSAGPVRGPAAANAVAHVFVDALDDRCEIVGDDGHHLQRVRRIAPGEIVTAADGSGAWRTYEVTDVAPHRLTLDARAPAAILPEARYTIALAVALAKGGLDDVVAAATELGVDRVTPVRTERVIVRWDDSRARRAVARLRAVAREAAMQSRRVRVPVIDEVVDLAALHERPDLVIASLDGVGASELPWRSSPGAAGDRLGWTVVVGPEGGLGPDELSSFTDTPRLRLSPFVLRAVTAPIAAVAVLSQEAGRMSAEGPLSE
jgi:16S rRNA (uracil1498-N3)-methyltransferase